ncbi:MAG: DNA polymerase Y family protein [Rubrivivax sp.]|nr:MAG: DNA polymerase Y family protein [Rubrivivax sp.]
MLSWMALLPGSAPALDALSLAWWALQFTPRVALLDEAVVLELRASERLFGGAQALKRQVVQGAAQWGCTQWACAPTALAALAWARHGPRTPGVSRLDHLPLRTISAVRHHEATLSQLGCRTLGQVRGLPRDGLSRRFGAPLLHALDQAHGLKPEAFEWLQLPERFDARLELPGRVDTAAALVFAARRLLQPLCAWLAGRHSGIRAMTWRWQHDYHQRDVARQGELVVRLSDASRDLDRLHRLLAEHLNRTMLGGPVAELSLHADEVEALAIDSACLFQEHDADGLSAAPDGLASPAAQRRQREALSTLLDRLSARLGKARVKQGEVLADHRLELAQHWFPAVDVGTLTTAQGKVDAPLEDHPQPGWVLPQPLPLAMNGGTPEAPVYQGPLRLLSGPHRVEAGWWDGQAVTRDYHLAHSEQAGMLWVFQERPAGAAQQGPWFLHGIFA